MSRRFGSRLKRAATPQVFSLLGAVVGAAVSALVLRRLHPAPQAMALKPRHPRLEGGSPQALPPLVAMPVGDTTPPHGDALLGHVGAQPKKKRSRTPSKRVSKAAAPTPGAADDALELAASVASVSERSESSPPSRKGTKRVASTQSPRRGRSRPTK